MYDFLESFSKIRCPDGHGRDIHCSGRFGMSKHVLQVVHPDGFSFSELPVLGPPVAPVPVPGELVFPASLSVQTLNPKA